MRKRKRDNGDAHSFKRVPTVLGHHQDVFKIISPVQDSDSFLTSHATRPVDSQEMQESESQVRPTEAFSPLEVREAAVRLNNGIYPQKAHSGLN